MRVSRIDVALWLIDAPHAPDFGDRQASEALGLEYYPEAVPILLCRLHLLCELGQWYCIKILLLSLYGLCCMDK